MRSRLVVPAVAAAALVALVAAPVPTSGGDHPGHTMVTPDEIEWGEVASLPAGAKVAVIEGDPSQEGPFTMRIEFPANYTVPTHTHPTVERVTVLEGTFYLGIGETFEREKAAALPTGALAVMDTGVAMFGFTAEEGSVIQINGEGPWGITYLDPADDPRQANEE